MGDLNPYRSVAIERREKPVSLYLNDAIVWTVHLIVLFALAFYVCIFFWEFPWVLVAIFVFTTIVYLRAKWVQKFGKEK